MPDTVPDSLLSIPAAARALGLEPYDIRTMISHGQLTTVPIGARHKIRSRDVAAVLATINGEQR